MGLKTATIILLAYFLTGTMFLPIGDFSTLPDLPRMYADCKKLEDTDMDLTDFVTGHLLQVDGLFGNDKPELDEKPHQPVQFHHQFVQINFSAKRVKIEVAPPLILAMPFISRSKDTHLSGYTVSVFRPPMG